MMQVKCKSCDSFYKSHFCTLKQVSLELIETSKTRHTYKKNEIIFRQGEVPQGLYCVASGAVKLVRTDADGKEFLFRIYTAGSIVGYRALFSDENYHATAIAYEASEICMTPKDVLVKMMQKDVQLSLNFLKQVCLDLREIEERMTSVVVKPVQQRVAEALLVLKKALPESKWTRRDIADWSGTTPETVIRTLAEFERNRLIDQQGRAIHILNLQALNHIASLESSLKHDPHHVSKT